MKLITKPFWLALSAVLWLSAACGNANPTPTLPSPLQSTVMPLITPSPVRPNPTATATAPPQPRLLLVSPDNSSLAEIAWQQVQSYNTRLTTRQLTLSQTAELETALASEAAEIVLAVTPDGAALFSVAQAHPQIFFLALLPTSPLPSAAPNLLVWGDPVRSDQIGFVAGMVSGFATTAQVVGFWQEGVEDVASQALYFGFDHGLHLTCGSCDLQILSASDDSPAALQTALAQFKKQTGDIVFLPNRAALRQAATDAGILYTTFPTTADIASPSLPFSTFNPPIPALLDTLLAGQTPDNSPLALSYTNGTLQLISPSAAQTLTQGDRDWLADYMTRLQRGQLGTGVDLTTGLEQ